ncbi:unnamed protein product [Musa hybrid cultivar]
MPLLFPPRLSPLSRPLPSPASPIQTLGLRSHCPCRSIRRHTAPCRLRHLIRALQRDLRPEGRRCSDPGAF